MIIIPIPCIAWIYILCRDNSGFQNQEFSSIKDYVFVIIVSMVLAIMGVKALICFSFYVFPHDESESELNDDKTESLLQKETPIDEEFGDREVCFDF